MKKTTYWFSQRLHEKILFSRWGHYGVPVLVFPTAGGDAEEIERFELIEAVMPLIRRGIIKVYSVDSVAGRAMVTRSHPPAHVGWLQNQFSQFIYNEIVPAIRLDCRSEDVGILVAGASIGAFNALSAICRYPDVFTGAVCMSGTFDLERFLQGQVGQDFYYSSPLHFLPNLTTHQQLDQLRSRFVVLAHGNGRWEDPLQNWRMARLLGDRGVPNRVDAWGLEYDHNWATWRAMLPKYLYEMVVDGHAQ